MFTDPVKNLKMFGLGDNMIVADFGAGTGFYSIAAAEMVPSGKVYAIEIQKDFSAIIKDKARDAKLDNIEVFLSDIEKQCGTKIKDGIVDAVIISNVLFQINNKEKFADEVNRILKSKGRIFLIDWVFGTSPIGPNLKMSVSKEQAREIFEKKGFVFERYVDVGIYNYAMIFKKS